MARKIKLNYDFLFEKLKENGIDEYYFFMYIVLDNFNDETLRVLFSDILMKFAGKRSYQENIAVLSSLISNDQEYRNTILSKLIKSNNQYIEDKNYQNLSDDEMITEFTSELIRSTAGAGMGSEQLILYFYSKRDFNNEKIPFLINYYKKDDEKNSNYRQNENEKIPYLQELLRNSSYEQELREYYYDRHISDMSEADYIKLAGQYKVKYKNGEYIIPRGVLVFFNKYMVEIQEKKLLIVKLFDVIQTNIVHINKFFEKIKYFLAKEQELKEENRRLKLKNKNLQVELKKIKQINSSKTSKNDTVKQISDLSNTNYYLMSRIEKLEEIIANYEEEKELNKTIVENIDVPELEKTGKVHIDFLDVMVLGGFWNSRTKEEVQEAFINSSVVFIEADKILRNSDKINNADLIIFDTSKNSHALYNKVKSINKNLIHISKSNLLEIKKYIEI
jgi:hypothetical protein